MNEPRTYKHNTATIVFVFFISLIALSSVCFGFGFVLKSPVLAILSAIFVGIFLMFAIYSYTTKTIISEEEITSQTLLGARTLRWSEIHSVSGSGTGIKLHNRDGDVTVSETSRQPGYLEVVDIIGAKRPDLFDTKDFSVMRRGFGQLFWLLISLALVVGGTALYGFVAMDEISSSNEAFFTLIFLIVIFLWVLYMILSAPQSVVFEGNTVRLNYLLGKKMLNANEIAAVYFTYTQTRRSREYYVALLMPGGRKKYSIPSLGVGLPIGYLVLKNWHTKNK